MHPALQNLHSPDAPGIFPDVPAEQYHRGWGLSIGTLMEMGKSPAHFLHALTAETDPEDDEKECFVVGRLAHEFCLEGKRDLPPDMAVKPEGMSFATKEGKSWKADAIAAGKGIITAEAWREIRGMSDAIAAHRTASAMFAQGRPEVSIYVNTETDGVPFTLRARLDWQPDDHADLPDLKTCGMDLDDAFIQREIVKRGLHCRGAWYLDVTHTAYVKAGLTPPRHYTPCFVEKKAPHGIMCRHIAPEAIEVGRRTYLGWLARLAECVKADSFPGYPDEVHELGLPRWAETLN